MNLEWLQTRQRGIGGSDAGAILGLSSYKSPLSVYFDKVSEIKQADEQTIQQLMGSYSEPLLRDLTIKWFKEQHGVLVTITEDNETHFDGIFLANLDGRLHHPVYGECGLELKTVDPSKYSEWTGDNLPDTYYIQCQHYMMVTGMERFFIAYLMGNRDFNVKEIPRNDRIIAGLRVALTDFWHDHVIPRIPPPTTWHDDGDILKALYEPAGDDKTVNLDHLVSEYREYKVILSRERLLAKRKQELKGIFMSALKNAELGDCDGQKVSWKEHKTLRI